MVPIYFDQQLSQFTAKWFQTYGQFVRDILKIYMWFLFYYNQNKIVHKYWLFDIDQFWTTILGDGTVHILYNQLLVLWIDIMIPLDNVYIYIYNYDFACFCPYHI
jgi:hypothetical protein